nr:DUF6600 domain-containing protein [uncultured Sphaerochaeta sp.]
MKKLFIALVLFLAGLGINKAQDRYNVDFNYFYHTLAPYGEWISIDADLVVWRPSAVQIDWRPYSIGNWSWTENGWYWDSYEPFGWATYHYGRWIFDDYYGWVWMPDNVWGPAWVEWRYDDNYIGWAPLPPYATFHVDFGIHFSINWRSNYRHWNFVGYRDFCDLHVYYHFINHSFVHNFFSRTKYRTNYYRQNDGIFNGGVHRKLVEKRSGVVVRERNITRTNSLEDFKNSRERNDNVIRAFRPEGKELQRYNKSKDIQIRNGNRNLDINRDKITISGRSRDNDSRSIENEIGEINQRTGSRVKDSNNTRTEVRDVTKKQNSGTRESPVIKSEKKNNNESNRTEVKRSTKSSYSPKLETRKSTSSRYESPQSTTRSTSSSSVRTKSRR